MKVYETKQGKEFVFNNKFSKNKISRNDRRLNAFLKLRYRLIIFFHLQKFAKKKSWYRTLEYHWGKRYRKPNANEKKRANQNVRLTKKDLFLKELIVYDLMPKEYLDEYKRKYFKFKSIFSAPTLTSFTPKQIHDAFAKMENSCATGSWYNLDHFSIKEKSSLGSRFNWLRIEAIGLTESFYIIRYALNVNDVSNFELEQILKAKIYKEAVCFSNDKWWKKRSFGGCYFYDLMGDAKKYAIEDYILELKELFWKEIVKNLPTFFFSWENIPPSIEVYSSETLEKKKDKILEVLAQRNYDNIEYCESYKTYFIPSVLSREQKSLNNSKIIADSKQFESDHGLYDFLNIEEIVCQRFADYFLLEGLSRQISKLIYQAQRKINQNVYRKARFNSLLSVKLAVEKQLYFYRRLYKELNAQHHTEEMLRYQFNDYKICFINLFDKEHPNLLPIHCFENEYNNLLYTIKEKHSLMESIYAHFDENSKITESRYNYRIVKWTFIIGVISLLTTVLLAGDPCLLKQIWDSIVEFFTKK
ncbi:MAG: hypothetical protein E7641_06645 [Ruminococcaceae bacterium]|nr:hypothetical protein [Oscillospiraceae bacterium]